MSDKQPINERAMRPGYKFRRGDPTDYTEDELEFMQAMDQYRRENRRPFPTCSEVLEVLLSLGYCKTGGGDPTSSERSDFQGSGPS